MPLGWVGAMNVIQTPPVEIALRTLGEEDRRRVSAWFGHLRNWEKDAFVREHSQKLHSTGDVYVLKTSDDFRIFFRLEQDRIVILDIATKATIVSSGHTSEKGR
jgi:mRNA-degrading endonuclease RelE of RelBE toxin-antitoxin system